VISLQDRECGDLILTTAKSSIYSTKPYSALIRGKIMKFIGIVIGWCTMLILIVAWFAYVIYDYGITGE